MHDIIVPIYNGLSVTFLFITIVASSVLYNCHQKKDYGATMVAAVGLFLKNISLCFLFAWLATARGKRLSGEPYIWMMDHWAIPTAALFVFIGGLFVTNSLTGESPYGRMSWLCAGIGLFIILLTWAKG